MINSALHAFVLLIWLILTIPLNVLAQHHGCTDSAAVNFSPAAMHNNGNCRYPVTLYNPTVAFELPNEISENSGLIMMNDRLWTFNDSGGLPVLYAVDTSKRTVVQRIKIVNATNTDWEDITLDSTYIYIGDFGNNRGSRKDLKIYRITRAGVPVDGDAEVDAEIIAFSYPEQLSFERSRSHNFDCEAMIAAGDSLYLFTKNRGDGQTVLYSLPKTPGIWQAKKLATFNSRGLITGADYNPVKKEIVLTGYTNETYMPFVWLLYGFENQAFFSANKRRIDLLNLITTQIEAITYLDDHRVIISAETSPSFKARAFYLDPSVWTGADAHAGRRRKSGELNLYMSENDPDILTVEWPQNWKGEGRLEIFDQNNSRVFSSLEEVKAATVSVNLKGLAAGVYNLNLLSKKKRYSAAFVKQ